MAFPLPKNYNRSSASTEEIQSELRIFVLSIADGNLGWLSLLLCLPSLLMTLYFFYAIVKAYQSLPDTASYVPLFSTNPRRISAEGIRWRKRAHLAMLFNLFWVTS